MAHANKEAQKYFDATDLSADLDGDAVDVREQDSGGFFMTWSGASATDAVVKAQESGDKTNWQDISSASVTIGAASGTDFIKLTADVLQLPYVRLVIVHNSESSGTVTAGYFFKGKR